MSAGFFKRLMSSVIDISMVLLIVYFAFALVGKPLLQKRVDNFDVIFNSYSDVLTAYNEDLNEIQTQYDVDMEIANGDSALEQAAQLDFQAKSDMLKLQNSIDVEPFNYPLTTYYFSVIYFYAIGFIVLMTIYTIAINGKTLGRKFMQIKLDGNVNRISVFFHDIMLKYFFLVILLAINLYYGFMFLLLSFAVDLVLITFTRNKTTLRDMLLKIKISKAGYGY